MDIVELVFYNGILSTISMDGKKFFYVNTLRKVKNLPFKLRLSRNREPYIHCFCCPPNSVRTIAEAGNYAYSLSESGLWVNLYGSNILRTELADGDEISVKQESEYPWHGKVRLTLGIKEKKRFSIMLRIPGWSDGADCKINGKLVNNFLKPAQYEEIDRTWSDGDTIELDLPMRIQLIKAHPYVEEARNQVAVKRGPIIYCLESVDLPQDVNISEVRMPKEVELHTRVDAKLFGRETVVMEGKVLAFPEKCWDDCLYQELLQVHGEEINIRLVPYYTWGNRGDSEMTVWIPLN